MPSFSTAIVQNEVEVDQALSSVGLTKEFVVRVARAAAAARAESLPVDPVSAPGMNSYIHGVRHIRLGLLTQDGWRINRSGNVESTVNDDLGVQICFQNVVNACDIAHDPQAISRKGTAARQLVAEGQGDLFDVPSTRATTKYGRSPTVWIICVQADDQSLKAEVSCPKTFEGSQFEEFHQRIFVLDETYDDWDPYNDDSLLDDIDVIVSKK
ncbi:MAG: hypothetical protein ABW095_02665 [Candidatus Thiodiazotropha sp.]